MTCNFSDAILPGKFDENNFWIWQREMEQYLSHLKLDKYLSEDKPVNHVGNTDVLILASEEASIYGDYMCKGVKFGRLINHFYALYSQEKLLRICSYLWRRITKHT